MSAAIRFCAGLVCPVAMRPWATRRAASLMSSGSPARSASLIPRSAASQARSHEAHRDDEHALARIAQADAEADQAAASDLWTDNNTAALTDAMAALKEALEAGDIEAAKNANDEMSRLVGDIELNLGRPARRREIEAKVRTLRKQREANRAASTKKK